jgi:hypothetical protein
VNGETDVTVRAAHEALERSLTNQPPLGAVVVEAFEAMRVPAKAFGHAILSICPASRERSVALTKLEEAVMWATKSIALNQEHVMPAAEGGES